VDNWLCRNGLATNAKKTVFLFMHPVGTDHEAPEVRLGGKTLPHEPVAKILGFLLDEKLNMSKHVDAAVKKIRSGTYAIRVAGRNVDLRCRRILHDSLVMSHANYCDALLGQANDTDLQRLQRAHNKAVRAVAQAPPRASHLPLLSRLGMLESKRAIHTATTVWRCLRGDNAPEAVSALLRPTIDVHRYETRQSASCGIFVPQVRTSRAQRSFAYHAAAVWNALPRGARCARDANECRQRAFKHFRAKTDQLARLDRRALTPPPPRGQD
jgi:hypothetical protein